MVDLWVNRGTVSICHSILLVSCNHFTRWSQCPEVSRLSVFDCLLSRNWIFPRHLKYTQLRNCEANLPTPTNGPQSWLSTHYPQGFHFHPQWEISQSLPPHFIVCGHSQPSPCRLLLKSQWLLVKSTSTSPYFTDMVVFSFEKQSFSWADTTDPGLGFPPFLYFLSCSLSYMWPTHARMLTRLCPERVLFFLLIHPPSPIPVYHWNDCTWAKIIFFSQWAQHGSLHCYIQMFIWHLVLGFSMTPHPHYVGVDVVIIPPAQKSPRKPLIQFTAPVLLCVSHNPVDMSCPVAPGLIHH